MEKRLFLAIFLSIAFLWAWGMLAPRIFPELAKKPVETGREREAEPPEAGEAPPPAELPGEEPEATASAPATGLEPTERSRVAPVAASSEEQVVVENDFVRAVFSNRGAVLRSLRLREYREIGSDERVELIRQRQEDQPYPFAVRSGDAAFNRFAAEALYRVERTDPARGATEIRFHARDEAGREITKQFVFGDEIAFSYEIIVDGVSEPYRVVIGPGIGRVGAQEDDRFEMSGNLVVRADGEYEMVKRKNVEEFMTIDHPTFIGLADHYFLAVLFPKGGATATVRPVEMAGKSPEEGTIRELYVGVNAIEGTVAGRAYFGPKKAEILERYGLEESLELGIFGGIARFLLTALLWVNSFTHNFGWAIVVLTVLIKLVLYPLQHKSIVSMKRMQKVQPKVNAIRDKYRKAKTDPQQKQKMNLEMMELYKKEGINPMSGCLPILLQLPILWAFYILLSHAIELRGEPFILWITDLSAKDPYYITPILMTITMFIQQWITPTAADPVQRKIFLAMPIVFGYIFKEFPSGLVLYWLVQNLLTILQQGLMNRWWKEHPEALEKGGAS